MVIKLFEGFQHIEQKHDRFITFKVLTNFQHEDQFIASRFQKCEHIKTNVFLPGKFLPDRDFHVQNHTKKKSLFLGLLITKTYKNKNFNSRLYIIKFQ